MEALEKLKLAALKSITMEMKQMTDMEVFEPINYKELFTTYRDVKVIPSSMHLREKYAPDGTYEKLKARFTAGGHKEMKIYTDLGPSPTISSQSIFIITAIAGKEERLVAVLDIGGAYLNAKQGRRTVLMRIDKFLASVLLQIKPEWNKFRLKDGSMIVKLKKALYGCYDSAALWYETLTTFLKSIGFVPNEVDKCVMNAVIENVEITIGIHVDDLIITCKDKKVLDSVIEKIREKFKSINVKHGPIVPYLGMMFDFTEKKKVKVTMNKFTKEILESMEVKGTAATPASEDLFKINENATKLSLQDKKTFHSTVAKLLYMCKRTRPDMLLTVNFLTTRISSPDIDDWNKLMRLLKYLNGTKEFGIALEVDNYIEVKGYIDASYGIHPDRKSHNGMTITLGKGPIEVKSSKQRIVSKSSTEAELIALSDCSSQVIWCRNFLIQQGYNLKQAIIYQDNKSTINLANNGKSNSDRTRHISIRYFFIKDRIDSKDIKIHYKKSEDMIADILTKPLDEKLFIKLRTLLLNWK